MEWLWCFHGNDIRSALEFSFVLIVFFISTSASSTAIEEGDGNE